MLSKNTCFNTKTHIGKCPQGTNLNGSICHLINISQIKSFERHAPFSPFKKKRRVFEIIVLFFINQFITRNKNILQRPIDWEQRWADVIIETCSYVDRFLATQPCPIKVNVYCITMRRYVTMNARQCCSAGLRLILGEAIYHGDKTSPLCA